MEISTDQWVKMLCGWGVKAGMWLVSRMDKHLALKTV